MFNFVLMYRIIPLLLTVILAFSFIGSQSSECDLDQLREWGTGLDNQRKADLGNGTYLNPIMPGDHPDPTIIKDGDDYYMTFSSFEAYPGLQIYHSLDLVNWQSVWPALETYIGIILD